MLQDSISSFCLTGGMYRIDLLFNFKELIKEVINDVIESFNNIGEEIHENLFDTKELESPKVLEKPSPSEGNRKLRRMQAKANRKKRK